MTYIDKPCEAKTAPFYFYNSFVRTSSIIAFSAHISFNKLSIMRVFHILYIIGDGEPA